MLYALTPAAGCQDHSEPYLRELIGLFALGLYALGLFALGLFALGLFTLGLFHCAFKRSSCTFSRFSLKMEKKNSKLIFHPS